MKLEDKFTINAPLETVWEFLLDIPKVSTCTPGVEEVKQVEPDVYDGLLKVKVGPVSAAFSGRVSIVERLPAKRMVARIEGRDKATASNVKATFSADLKPEGSSTLILYSLDVTLRGRLAQFGLAVVQGTAKKMAGEFANCIQEALSPQEFPKPSTGLGRHGRS
jgi:carbon monoxide dehydrogenase subunit G